MLDKRYMIVIYKAETVHQSLYLLQWEPEIRHHCGSEIPVILVGTKSDLREDPDIIAELAKERKSPVSYVEGLKLQKQIRAVKYIECSAKTLTNIHEVFELAIRAVIEKRQEKPKKRVCTLL